MGRYEREARQHADKIRYYYEHADGMGHSQAECHYFKLSDLIGRAFKSKNDRNDVVIIQSLKETTDPLMEEMKEREKAMVKEREEREAQQQN